MSLTHDLEITLTGRIPSKKNSKQIVCRGKYPKVLPSAKYKEWHVDALNQLLVAGVPRALIHRCTMDIVIYFPDNRKADLTNKAESIMDLLVDYGLLVDDQWQVVTDLALKGYIDKKLPRAEITVRQY